MMGPDVRRRVRLAVCLLVSGLFACDSGPSRPEHPDVLLLVVDTLRADHLGFYGYDRETSPALDRFAAESTVWMHVVAPSSWTLPSVGSLLTSTYPSVHGLSARQSDSEIVSMREGLHTLAEAFRQAGYRTAAVGTNPWVNSEDHGLHGGFDEFRKIDWTGAEAVNALAKEILSSQDPRPVFLYLHYMDVHGPYIAGSRVRAELGAVPPSYRRAMTAEELDALPEYLRLPGRKRLGGYLDAYDRGIRAWDDAFGRFLAWLGAEGRLERSLVAVVSDHGEEFLEHGGWNHGETLYEEQIAVPWILRIPGEPHRRVQQQVVSLIDVAPTLLARAGVQAPSTMSGVDALGKPGADLRRSIMSETGVRLGGIEDETKKQVSVRRGQRKMIVSPTGTLCFDLARDPGEQSPVAGQGACDPYALGELAAWRADSARKAAGLGESSVHAISPEQQERLRELGYGE